MEKKGFLWGAGTSAYQVEGACMVSCTLKHLEALSDIQREVTAAAGRRLS